MNNEELIKISSDKEKARSILKMVMPLLRRLESTNKSEFPSLTIADYYEAIKELLTAILLTDGFKTLSHKILIEYAKNLKGVREHEYYLMDGLRVLRNRVEYDGFFVSKDYLERKEQSINSVVSKLIKILKKKLS